VSANSISYEITPRHLIFNILEQCGGRISREDLINYLYNLSTELSKRGYRIQLVLKGSQANGWWNDDIDGELVYWVTSGIIKKSKKSDILEFSGRNSKPFSSLEDVVMLVNSGLEAATSSTLINLTKQIVKC